MTSIYVFTHVFKWKISLCYTVQAYICTSDSPLPHREQTPVFWALSKCGASELPMFKRIYPTSQTNLLVLKELSSLAITRGGRHSKMASGRENTHVLLTGSPGILHSLQNGVTNILARKIGWNTSYNLFFICQVLARQLFVGKFTKFLKIKASRCKDFIQRRFATAKRGVGWGLMLSHWMGSVDLWQERKGTLLLILSTNKGYSESVLQ